MDTPMRNKHSLALLYILNLGLLGSLQTAYADDIQAKFFEKDLSEFVAQHGTTSPDYPRRLANLAGIYLKCGMSSKAEETFAKAIESAKTFRNPDLMVPEITQVWASELAVYDLQKAKKYLLEGMQAADRMAFGSKVRLDYMYGMIQFYRQYKCTAEEQKQIVLLDEQLKALEKAKGLSEGDIGTLAGILTQMSDLYCMPPPILLNGDESNQTSRPVTKTNYEKAEEYQLRAIAQFDKLSKERRIAAHISLRRWFEFFGKTAQAESEERKLDAIGNGVDWRELARKKPRPCLGCGMG